MKPEMKWLAIPFGSAILLAGCGNESRFDDAAVVDVCKLVDQAEAERILGPLVAQPKRQPEAGGLAGDCTWTFESGSGSGNATLHVMLTTQGSGGELLNLDRWFHMSLEEAKVSLGAHPWEMKDLGDEAFLFQSPQPDLSEIWLRQSNTYVVLRTDGASSSKLDSFARAVARALAPAE